MYDTTEAVCMARLKAGQNDKYSSKRGIHYEQRAEGYFKDKEGKRQSSMPSWLEDVQKANVYNERRGADFMAFIKTRELAELEQLRNFIVPTFRGKKG